MGGTTEEIMMPRTSAASILSTAKRLRKSTPYSSTVWVLMVATRQWAIMRGPELAGFTNPGGFSSYTPRTVLVLPTSITSSIRSPWQGPHAAGNCHTQSVLGADAQEATSIQPVSYATVTAVFVHMHVLAVSIGGA